MQIKGFLLGLAIASLAWASWQAWPQAAAERSGAAATEHESWVETHVRWHSLSEEERAAHLAELRERWDDMTREQREAHRGMLQCPYSGRAGGTAGTRGRPEPIEI